MSEIAVVLFGDIGALTTPIASHLGSTLSSTCRVISHRRLKHRLVLLARASSLASLLGERTCCRAHVGCSLEAIDPRGGVCSTGLHMIGVHDRHPRNHFGTIRKAIPGGWRFPER